MIELGSLVKCKVTGYKGIATARIVYLNGCVRVEVTPQGQTGDKGIEIKSTFLDEGQLEVVGNGINKKPKKVKETGGPRECFPHRKDPKRAGAGSI